LRDARWAVIVDSNLQHPLILPVLAHREEAHAVIDTSTCM